MERLAASRWALALALLVSALIGAAAYAAVSRLSPAPPVAADKARIERVVHDYVMANPELIPAAMERLRDRESSAAVASVTREITTPYAGAIAGNPRGDVTVVEYFDYNCGYCRKSLDTVRQLIAADSGVRVVFRELPILAEESALAARWSLAAAEQGKFVPFHEALYAGGRVSQATIDAAARTAGLDRARALATIRTPRIATELNSNMATAQRLGVSGTPAWVIGDRVLAGALPLDELVRAVREARSKRRA